MCLCVCVWCSAQALGKGPAGRKLGLLGLGSGSMEPLTSSEPCAETCSLEEGFWPLEPVLVTPVFLLTSWATLLRREGEIRTFSSAPAALEVCGQPLLLGARREELCKVRVLGQARTWGSVLYSGYGAGAHLSFLFLLCPLPRTR